MRFGRARKTLARDLADLEREIEVFGDKHGPLQSAIDLAPIISASSEILRQTSDLPIGPELMRKVGKVTEFLRDGAFCERISSDLEHEQAEQGADSAAGRLLEVYRKVERSCTALCTCHDELAENDPDGVIKMVDTAAKPERPRDTGVTVRIASEPSGRFSRISMQMVATLNRLGLPHDSGVLDVDGGDPAGPTRLIAALNNRFEIASDTVNGMRARLRRQALNAPSQATSDLTGRIALDAQAIAVDADRLLLLVGELERQTSDELFRDEPKVTRSYEDIADQLSEIRDLAARPSGLPVHHADARIKSLRQRMVDHFRLLGIPGVGVDAFSGDHKRLKDQLLKSAARADKSSSIHESTMGLVSEAIGLATLIEQRLMDAMTTRSKGELTYRLRRALEAAAQSVDTALLSLESAPNSYRWQAIDLAEQDSFDEDYLPQNLADGLDETLRWLKPLAERYGQSDLAYQRMTSRDLGELNAELRQISTTLDDCASKLRTPDADADEQFIDLIEGLAQLTRTAASMAEELARTA
jgi:hypothetical protein